MVLIAVAASMAACSGTAKPKPAELPPNNALMGVRQAWTAKLPSVAFPLQTAVSGDTVKYYEVRLSGIDRATVRRYEASKTHSGRTQVPFAVTHEAVAKLAGDICG